MRLLLPIILLAGLLHAQDYWVRWNGELTIPDQREFAEKCYEFGKQYGRGHTLIGLGYESILGQDTTHDENSIGYFGISGTFITMPIGELRRRLWRIAGTALYRRLAEIDRRTFEGQAVLALCLFEDNYEHFRRLGYSPGAAWYAAAGRYNAGSNWAGRAGQRYARLFNARVAFLKTQIK